MYMHYCGIIVGETYRTDLSFRLEAMCTLQNAMRANLINPINKSKVRKLRICTIGHRY